MQTEIYKILMIVAFSLSAGFLIVAAILFFKLKVVSVIEELSGKRARKQVAEIRKENTSVKSRGYVSGIFGSREAKTSKTTEKLTGKTGRITEEIDADVSEGTVLLTNAGIDEDNTGTSLLMRREDEEGTTILAAEEETTLLNNRENAATVGNSGNVLKEIVVTESEDYLRI